MDLRKLFWLSFFSVGFDVLSIANNHIFDWGQEAMKDLLKARLKKGPDSNLFVAKVGHSEHQLGTTVDFGTDDPRINLAQAFDKTEVGEWLAENAWAYGFVMSYPEEKRYYWLCL